LDKSKITVMHGHVPGRSWAIHGYVYTCHRELARCQIKFSFSVSLSNFVLNLFLPNFARNFLKRIFFGRYLCGHVRSFL